MHRQYLLEPGEQCGSSDHYNISQVAKTLARVHTSRTFSFSQNPNRAGQKSAEFILRATRISLVIGRQKVNVFSHINFSETSYVTHSTQQDKVWFASWIPIRRWRSTPLPPIHG